MLIVEILVGMFLTLAWIHFWLAKKKNEFEEALIAKKVDKSDQLKRTLAMGIYYRFSNKQTLDGEVEKLSSLYLNQVPLDLEKFVAEILEAKFGGSTWVTPPVNDHGVDIEHERSNGLYLIQVKCSKDDLDFAPIAFIHSNMEKRKAKGGAVVTTGSFTQNAKDYARGLNIELIDGMQLVEYWLDTVENVEEMIQDLVGQGDSILMPSVARRE